MLQAADRGVRVRILLDDVFTTVKDDELALLDQHANIEVRLFNPVSRRGFYYLNYAGDFKRANRRMHSKSFTVDGAVTIVGGRNIADEYFQINTDNDFIDFDILAFGPIVPDVAEQFDDFWNSDRAVPITELDHNVSKNDLQDARDDIDDEMRSRTESIYAAAVNAEYMLELIEGTAILYPAEAYLINDKSSKLETPISESEMVVAKKLTDIAQLAKHSITIITPYFVPRKTGVEFWRSIRAKDIELTIVTNSLASTNHVPVHSAYSRYRKPMLEMGAELYEARVDAVNKTGTGGEPETLTLHTKLIVIDDRYLFIGSLNLDPRSIEINAEMGILVDSKEMGKEFQGYLEDDLETWAYKLSLNDKGKTLWRADINGEDMESTKEPDTGTWRRFLSKFYRILPESQL